VEWGGEGIVLKDRRSIYKPGTRSRGWWKAKQKLTLPVEVLDCAPELVPWGDWGHASFAYCDPRSGELVTVEQAVRVPGSREPWPPSRPGGDPLLGRAAERAAAPPGSPRVGR